MQLDSTAVVIAHFDPAGRIAAHLIEFLARLKSMDCRVVFVSTRLSADEARRVSALGEVIVRENVGYDFWSYKVGIEALGSLERLRRVVICNSSFVIIDPARLCACAFRDQSESDLLGLTFSREHRPHLQSFWISFETERVLRSGDFSRWWSAMTPISDRQQVIERYELGLSDFFLSKGFSLAPLYRPDKSQRLTAICRAIECGAVRVEVPDSGRISLDVSGSDFVNPTLFSWDGLLEQAGIIKLDLIKRNVYGVNLAAFGRLLASDANARRLVEDAIRA